MLIVRVEKMRTVVSKFEIYSIKGLSLGSKDYTNELKTVQCTSFLGQTR